MHPHSEHHAPTKQPGRRWRYAPVHTLAFALLIATALAMAQAPVGTELLDRPLPASKTDLDDILKRGYIRVLVTHSRTNFFVDRGRPQGFEYELLQAYKDKLKKRTKKHFAMFFFPVAFDELIPGLLRGKGDIAAAGLTVTPARTVQVAFTEPYLNDVTEIVVTHTGVTVPDRVEALAGREVHVVRRSSYADHLGQLNERFLGQGLKPIRVIEADKHLEAEDLLEMVHAGIISYTVVDNHVAELWAKVLKNLVLLPELAVHPGGDIAWAVRGENPALLADLNRFVRQHRKGTLLGNVLFRRYFENTKWVSKLAPADQRRLTELTAIFKKYADRYDFDWLLLAALAYQESGFDQRKRSPVGAVGVMQVRPTTAADRAVGIPDVENLENNIHAGAKYLDWLRRTYFDDAAIAPEARIDFALAAYNAGPGRVAEFRKRAPRLGYDPTVWFDNVEDVALRVVGWETVRYVANINKYYYAFKLSEQTLTRREDARGKP